MRQLRPDPGRELRAMLRAPEVGSYNLAAYVREHAAELGLGDLGDLRQHDEVLAPRLLVLLEDRRQQQRRDEGQIEAVRLHDVRESARWVGPQVVVLPRALFRLALAVKGKKYIRFIGHDVDVAISRWLLVRAGAALRVFTDLEARVDTDGVHLRWRGGRGRLNLCPQTLREPADALVVSLRPRTVHRTMPALLGEVLAEMGLGT